MNWINNVVRPKIRSFLKPKDSGSENLWVKCPESGEMVFYRDLEANQWVVPNSGYHMKIKAADRLATFFDHGEYRAEPLPAVGQDPLKFRDQKRYVDRLKETRTKTGTEDAVTIATGKLCGTEITVGVQDFDFMGGSLGLAAGAAIVRGMELALERRTAFVMFCASGGARMQEGVLSLMQLPRTTVAVQRLKEAGLPYIVLLTDPTTGGVSASFAMQGDIILAEPGAVIGFAGQRVIKQTIGQDLPEGFQTAEFLLEKGQVDDVVPRPSIRETTARLLRHMRRRKVTPAKGAAA